MDRRALSETDAAARAEELARAAYGRLLAILAARDGDIEAAEDCLADAFERALRTWPETGVPDNPAAWLLTVARNRRHAGLGPGVERPRKGLGETVLGPLDVAVARGEDREQAAVGGAGQLLGAH